MQESASDIEPKSGLAKRLIEAAHHLFVRKDAESALLPLCLAIDRVSKDLGGATGRRGYQQFIHDRMEIITRTAFDGLAILNLHFELDPLHDEKGKLIPPDEKGPNGESLYSFQQIIYHLIRCKLAHTCDVAPLLRDSGRGSGLIWDDNGILHLPFEGIALGLFMALLGEVDLEHQLSDSVVSQVAWRGVPLAELCGERDRMLSIARQETTSSSP
jgi:hypothetical protein